MKIIIYPDNSVNFRDDENFAIEHELNGRVLKMKKEELKRRIEDEIFNKYGISKERLAPFDKTLDDTFHWIDGDLQIIAFFTGLQGTNYERSNQRARGFSRKIKTAARKVYENRYKGMTVHEKRVAMVNGVMAELGLELIQ